MLNSPCYVWCFYLLVRPVCYTIGVLDVSWQRWFFFLFSWLLRACLTFEGIWLWKCLTHSCHLCEGGWQLHQFLVGIHRRSSQCPGSGGSDVVDLQVGILEPHVALCEGSQSPIDCIQFPGPGMTPGMPYWAIGHLAINPNSAQFGSSGLAGSSNWPLPIVGSLQPWCLYFLLFYFFLCPPHCWAWWGSSNLQ